jgi:hypothetical protein
MIYIVESEEAYLNLIADLSKYGFHVPNQFATPDRFGMSISDSFDKLNPSIAEDRLAVRDYEHKVETVVDEDGTEWEEEPTCGEGPLDRSKLHICHTLSEQVGCPPPKESDYPILIMWYWSDDFDRFGNIKTRQFEWESLKSIKRVMAGERTPVAKKYRQWNIKYGRKQKQLLKAQEEYNRRKDGLAKQNS